MDDHYFSLNQSSLTTRRRKKIISRKVNKGYIFC